MSAPWRLHVVAFWVMLATVLASGCRPQETADLAPPDVRGEPLRKKAAAGNTASPVEPVTLATSPNPTPPPPPVAPPTLVPQPLEGGDANGNGKYLRVGFALLAGYNFELPDDMLAMPLDANTNKAAAVSSQIPQTVQALNNRRVAIQGFMLPLKVTGGYVTEMLIMKDQSMCCYGTVPKINEWVSVKMIGDGIKPVMDEPVTLIGTLHVGEMRENGYLVGIYSLDGERMEMEARR